MPIVGTNTGIVSSAFWWTSIRIFQSNRLTISSFHDSLPFPIKFSKIALRLNINIGFRNRFIHQMAINRYPESSHKHSIVTINTMGQRILSLDFGTIIRQTISQEARLAMTRSRRRLTMISGHTIASMIQTWCFPSSVSRTTTFRTLNRVNKKQSISIPDSTAKHSTYTVHHTDS